MTFSPETNLSDAITCLKEAAKLHLALGEASTEESIVGAMAWRYGISRADARQCCRSMTELLSVMPRRQS